MEQFLGQTWVLVTAFIAGPAFLVWMWRRRWLEMKRQKAGGQPAAAAATAPKASSAPKAAPAAPSRAPAESPSARSKPLEPGFRGLRWGQPPVDGMTVLHEEAETRFLVRPSDELRVGNVHVSSIVYSYRLERLEAVIVDLPSSGFEPLVRHLTSEWGSPRTANDRARHAWTDAGTGPEATQAVLEKRAEARAARLVLSSRAAHVERAKTRPGT